MQLNKIKSYIHHGAIFCFQIILLICFIFSVQQREVSTGFLWVAAIAYMLTGIVLMNYIFLYGDGEELHFSALFFAIPGAYLLYTAYSIFCGLSPLGLATQHDGNALFSEIWYLFYAFGLWNIISAIFLLRYKHWLNRLLLGISGFISFLPLIIIAVAMMAGAGNGVYNFFAGPSGQNLDVILSSIAFGISALLYGAYAFLTIRDCED